MGHVAAVLWDWVVTRVDEVVEGCDVGARRKRRGAAVRSVVVFERSEAEQDWEEWGHPHPHAGCWCVHHGPCREEYDVAVRQVKDNIGAQSGDAAPCGFGRGEADEEEVGPVVCEDVEPLASARHEH